MRNKGDFRPTNEGHRSGKLEDFGSVTGIRAEGFPVFRSRNTFQPIVSGSLRKLRSKPHRPVPERILRNPSGAPHGRNEFSS